MRMLSLGLGSFMLLALILFSASTLSAAAHMAGQTMTSNTSSRPVTVDGKWTQADEWAEAGGMGMQMMTGMGSMMQSVNPGAFRVKHDADFTYVMIEAMGDGRMDGDDMGCVAFDANHSGGSTPQQGDFRFCVQMMSQGGYRAFMNQGTGSGWSGEMVLPSGATMAASIGSSPSQPSPHMMYEFRIPRSMLGQSATMGTHMTAYDKGGDRWIVWPSSTSMNSPSAMGDLMIGGAPSPAQPRAIPGFDLASVLVGLVAGLLVLRMKPRKAMTKAH